MANNHFSAIILITRGDQDIEVFVEGKVWPPEKDAGIMSWQAEVESATDYLDNEIELTQSEEDRAADALVREAGH